MDPVRCGTRYSYLRDLTKGAAQQKTKTAHSAYHGRIFVHVDERCEYSMIIRVRILTGGAEIGYGNVSQETASMRIQLPGHIVFKNRNF